MLRLAYPARLAGLRRDRVWMLESLQRTRPFRGTVSRARTGYSAIIAQAGCLDASLKSCHRLRAHRPVRHGADCGPTAPCALHLQTHQCNFVPRSQRPSSFGRADSLRCIDSKTPCTTLAILRTGAEAPGTSALPDTTTPGRGTHLGSFSWTASALVDFQRCLPQAAGAACVCRLSLTARTTTYVWNARTFIAPGRRRLNQDARRHAFSRHKRSPAFIQQLQSRSSRSRPRSLMSSRTAA
ncbi:hypothetical protein EXIGLDRAFT_262757 [Exidia glandulosa HHB12029]|uniref:Uncharacterized protein n=1 Tax=Exidia glandulosa HHB12029 TaxID=1314781 RepID=A0A165DRX9_EXIGL|nr:hypothetical protein EXIGLDRAFT_262757 [Exidia glandulosa HHB12029]